MAEDDVGFAVDAIGGAGGVHWDCAAGEGDETADERRAEGSERDFVDCLRFAALGCGWTLSVALCDWKLEENGFNEAGKRLKVEG